MWHYVLIKALTEQIEAVWKTASHIILNFSRGMPHMVMLSAANPTLWPLVKMKCQANSFFTFLNPLLASITSQIQEITPFLSLGVMINTIECSLIPNVTAPLHSMH